ncbi:hypothetical protein [Actinocrispum wychmicini]|uniref:hypothetical protein n=1 Tax=Actinocrispum wychmicini TaxID=1213861 RepID=UPI001048ABA7|nr:hypothetical protein [Actinocrispum wychmicini]
MAVREIVSSTCLVNVPLSQTSEVDTDLERFHSSIRLSIDLTNLALAAEHGRAANLEFRLQELLNLVENSFG